jgi:membrane-bound ClpP family serine protease
LSRSYSRRAETIAALLDDIAVAGAVAAVITIGLHWAGFLSLSWVAIITGIVTGFVALVALAVYTVHARRPQVGPEALLGVEGSVVETIPAGGEGLVMVEGELWRARSVRDEDIPAGERVRVVGYEGLVLLVEKASLSRTPSQ